MEFLRPNLFKVILVLLLVLLSISSAFCYSFIDGPIPLYCSFGAIFALPLLLPAMLLALGSWGQIGILIHMIAGVLFSVFIFYIIASLFYSLYSYLKEALLRRDP
jgi:hypothetical protein